MPAVSGGHSASTSRSPGDEAGSSQGGGAFSGIKKKRGVQAISGDKSGRGLREYSKKVCEKVESKGRTTYNEVADEVVAEFAVPNSLVSPDKQQDEEKNIRRRVYDALNVLMAMGIISKDKKDLHWNGLPQTSQNDIKELQAECIRLQNRIEKKAPYLQELADQFVGLQNVIQRNEQLYGSRNASSGGVALPFILVQTRPHATVEVEISEDMQLVHFDFNSTPFEMHDDSYVLKAMRFYEREHNEGYRQPTLNGGECSSAQGIYQHHTPQLVRRNAFGRLPVTSHPLPGIIRVPRARHGC